MNDIKELEQQQVTIVQAYEAEHQHDIIMQFHSYDNKKTQVLIERARHFQQQVNPLQDQNYLLKDKLVGIAKVIEEKTIALRKLLKPVDYTGRNRVLLLATASFEELCSEFEEDWGYITEINETLSAKIQQLNGELVKAGQMRQRLSALHCQQLVHVKGEFEQQKVNYEYIIGKLQEQSQSKIKNAERKLADVTKELRQSKMIFERERVRLDQAAKMLQYQKNNLDSQIAKLKQEIADRQADMDKGYISIKTVYEGKIQEAVQECHKYYKAQFTSQKEQIRALTEQTKREREQFYQKQNKLKEYIQSLEQKTRNLQNQIKQLKKTLDETTQKSISMENQLSLVNNKFSELTEEKTKLKEMLDKRIEEFWALTKEIASLRITFEGQKSKLKQKIESLQQITKNFNAEKAKLTRHFQQKIWKLQDQQQQLIETFKKEFVRKLDYDMLKKDYENMEIDLLKVKQDRGIYITKLNTITEYSNTRIAALIALCEQKDKKISQLQLKCVNLIENSSSQYAKLKEANIADLKQKENEFTKRITELSQKNKSQISSYERKVKLLFSKLQQKQKQKIAQLQNLKRQHQLKFKAEVKTWQDKVRAMNQQFKKRLTDLDNENKRLRNELNMATSQVERFRELTKQTREIMGRLEEINKSNLKIQQDKHQKHIKQIISSFQKKICQIQSKHQQTIQSYEQEIKRLNEKSQINELIAKHTVQIEGITERHQDQISKVQSQAQRRMRQLENKYKAQRDALIQQQHKELQQAVLKLIKIHQNQLLELQKRLQTSLDNVQVAFSLPEKIIQKPVERVQPQKNIVQQRLEYNKKYQQFKQEILTSPSAVRVSKKSNEDIVNKLISKLNQLQNRFSLNQQLSKQLTQDNKLKVLRIAELQKTISDIQNQFNQQLSSERAKIERFFENEKHRLAKEYQARLQQKDNQHYQFTTKLRNQFDHMKRNHQEQLQYYEEKYDELKNILQQRPSRPEDVQVIEQLKEQKSRMKQFVEKAQMKINQAGSVVKYLQRELDNYKTVYDIFKPNPPRPQIQARRISLVLTEQLKSIRKGKRRSLSTLAHMKNSVSIDKIEQTTPMQLREFDRVFPLAEIQKKLGAKQSNKRFTQGNVGLDVVTKDAQRFLQRIRGDRIHTEEPVFGSEKKKMRDVFLKSFHHAE